MLDIHCHIIPSVDDGSRNEQESFDMLQAARAAGITRIMCTPHCRGRHFDPARIVTQYRTLEQLAAQVGIKTYLGFEVYWEKLIELGLSAATRLTLGGSRLILIEYNPRMLPVQWAEGIERLQRMGLEPIIAHPERYSQIQEKPQIAQTMKDMGCRLQLSCDYVSGGRIHGAKKGAQKLLKLGVIDYVASDAHCAADYEDFGKALAAFQASRK